MRRACNKMLASRHLLLKPGGAMTAETTRPASQGMFRSLSTRNYRLFFWGQLISICGTWMQTVAQSFLVLQLTNSGTQLGLATAARFVPDPFASRRGERSSGDKV